MKIVAENRRAKFDYAIGERLMAGIALSGPEVKSIKSGQVSLKGSFVRVKNGEAFLVNVHVTPYKNAAKEHLLEPDRERKLLLHRNEINRIATGGLSAVPLALGIEHGLIKVEVGLGKGKKRYDKREALKQRQQMRDAARDLGKS